MSTAVDSDFQSLASAVPPTCYFQLSLNGSVALRYFFYDQPLETVRAAMKAAGGVDTTGLFPESLEWEVNGPSFVISPYAQKEWVASNLAQFTGITNPESYSLFQVGD